MVQQFWAHENRKILVCVDSYENGIPQGRFHTVFQGTEDFESLSQLLIRLESILEEGRRPQAYTTSRSFSVMMPQESRRTVFGEIRPGAKATFELQILFRQHSSWQGLIIWKDKRVEQSFRSVLELVLLMDSALRGIEGYETV